MKMIPSGRREEGETHWHTNTFRHNRLLISDTLIKKSKPFPGSIQLTPTPATDPKKEEFWGRENGGDGETKMIRETENAGECEKNGWTEKAGGSNHLACAITLSAPNKR